MLNKKNVLIALVTLFVVLAGAVYFSFCCKPDFTLEEPVVFEVKNPPHIGKGFYLGGFSDLFYKNNHLYAITDRGPNTNIKNLENRDIRNFPLGKDYKPFLIEFELQNDGIAKISKLSKFNISGLPVSEARDCVPCDMQDKEMPFDPYGSDTESLAIDKNGHFWVGDEYFPSIIEFDQNLNVVNRFATINSPYANKGITCNLPEIFNKVQKNLGFESIAYDGNNHIYAFTQGSLSNGTFVKIVKFNIETKTPENVYSYYIGAGKNIISAATFISENEILTAERRNGEHQIRVLKLKPFIVNTSEKVLSLKGLNGIQNGQKIEGIAFDGNDKVYVINDNDFGIDDENRKDSFIMEFKLVRKN